MPIESRKKSGPPVLVLDFDGVIHSYMTPCAKTSEIPDPPVEGAMVFLREAMRHFAIHIHSARSLTLRGRTAMWEYIVKHYAHAHSLAYNDARKELSKLNFPVCKPHAHVTLDDRAITFTGSWPDLESLKNFKPWNR